MKKRSRETNKGFIASYPKRVSYIRHAEQLEKRETISVESGTLYESLSLYPLHCVPSLPKRTHARPSAVSHAWDKIMHPGLGTLECVCLSGA